RPFERSSQGVRALSKLHRSFDFGLCRTASHSHNDRLGRGNVVPLPMPLSPRDLFPGSGNGLSPPARPRRFGGLRGTLTSDARLAHESKGRVVAVLTIAPIRPFARHLANHSIKEVFSWERERSIVGP